MEPKNGALGADTGGRGVAKAVTKFNAQEYNGGLPLKINGSLLSVVLHELTDLPIEPDHDPSASKSTHQRTKSRRCRAANWRA
jgi:hypothetical protein